MKTQNQQQSVFACDGKSRTALFVLRPKLWQPNLLPVESLQPGDEELVPLSKRKMGAFHLQLLPNDCHSFFEVNADEFYQVELTSSLIMQGEMDTVLRITSSPNVDFSKWRLNKACSCAVSTKYRGRLEIIADFF